jgi:uncharacterized membrane protein required for colicin V production
MTAYDWIIVFFGVGLVVLFTFERMLRALFGLGVLWSATLMSSMLYVEVAHRVQAMTGPRRVLARGIIFDVLLLLIFVAGYVIIRLSFPDTRLPKLGFLDTVLGFVLGCVIAVVFMSLLVNSIGVMVVDRWLSDPNGWAMLRYTYLSSGLRPYTSLVLKAYSFLFLIFFRGLPPVLIPQ